MKKNEDKEFFCAEKVIEAIKRIKKQKREAERRAWFFCLFAFILALIFAFVYFVTKSDLYQYLTLISMFCSLIFAVDSTEGGLF